VICYQSRADSPTDAEHLPPGPASPGAANRPRRERSLRPRQPGCSLHPGLIRLLSAALALALLGAGCGQVRDIRMTQRASNHARPAHSRASERAARNRRAPSPVPHHRTATHHRSATHHRAAKQPHPPNTAAGSRRPGSMRSPPALLAFARSYLRNRICTKAPTAPQLADAIAHAIHTRPGTSRPAAASGICNPTR